MTKNTREAAADFLNHQLAIMRKYGAEPTLNEDQFEKLVDETERQLTRLRDRSDKEPTEPITTDALVSAAGVR